MTTDPSGSGRIPPGATIGILGGGQLGRMTAFAAQRLGYRVHVFSDQADAPACQVTDRATVAPFDDVAALQSFGRAVDVVTLEFENVPLAAVEALEPIRPVRPGAKALAVCQDRTAEKGFLDEHHVPTAAYQSVTDEAELARAVARVGTPAVLKTARLGYDGKGQARVSTPAQAGRAYDEIGKQPAIYEAVIDFEKELSVIAARGLDGSIETYPAVENRHQDHILARTVAPAVISVQAAAEADAIARRLAGALDLVGLLAVEMFLTHDGRILVNEMAPRPHNSGHWTTDGAATSQFEQLVRAVCGLTLGSVEAHCDVVMDNLLGDAADGWPEILAEPDSRLHLYGKAETRPGRKMGHVNRLYPKGSRGR